MRTNKPNLPARQRKGVPAKSDAIEIAKADSSTAAKIAAASDISTGATGATGRVAEAAGASQREGFAALRSTVEYQSKSLEELARNAESDAARVRLAELSLEHEKEKTEQAKIGKDQNDSNNSFMWRALQFVGYAAVAGLVVLTGGKILSSNSSQA